MSDSINFKWDCVFMVCHTCKTVEWVAEYEVTEYIEDRHQGHSFESLSTVDHVNQEYFRQWLLKLMGWSMEAED